MKRVRGRSKENIFVTNDYFKKYGISRQVVEYQRRVEKIEPFYELKGMKLYYLFDADFMIIHYWIDNFKNFVFEFEKTEKMKEECNKKINEILNQRSSNSDDEDNEEIEFLVAKRDRTSSSVEFHNLLKLLHQYNITDPEIPFLSELNKKDFQKYSELSFSINELVFRLAAYKESGLSFNEYLKKERPLRENRDNYNIYEYFLYQSYAKNFTDEELIEFHKKFTVGKNYKSAFKLLGLYSEHIICYE